MTLKFVVTLLEDDVSDLETDVEEIRTYNILQDERFLIIEGNVAENSNDVDGKLALSLSGSNDLLYFYNSAVDHSLQPKI